MIGMDSNIIIAAVIDNDVPNVAAYLASRSASDAPVISSSSSPIGSELATMADVWRKKNSKHTEKKEIDEEDNESDEEEERAAIVAAAEELMGSRVQPLTTLLQLACLVGAGDVAVLLAERASKAVADATWGEAGSTALHLAAFRGMHRVVAVLADKGANMRSRNRRGYRPIDCTDDEDTRKAFFVRRPELESSGEYVTAKTFEELGDLLDSKLGAKDKRPPAEKKDDSEGGEEEEEDDDDEEETQKPATGKPKRPTSSLITSLLSKRTLAREEDGDDE